MGREAHNNCCNYFEVNTKTTSSLYNVFFFFFFTIVSYNFNKTPINLNYSADYVFSALNI